LKYCHSNRAVLALVALWLASCASAPARREVLLSGETMGSAWTVKMTDVGSDTAALQRGIQASFDAVDLALSNWRDDSALSRFNADDSGNWQPVEPELMGVLAYALQLAELSDGAYDITVGPLVNLWGFGPDPASYRVPERFAIDAARARVGWRKVTLDPAAHRARKQPGVRLDLSSLGKGRGVDRVAEFLDSRGVTNYLIDLSGKLRARGTNPRGSPWRVLVERPGPDAGTALPALERGAAQRAAVELRDQSIATAGDYRRYFQSGGRHYSHIIDPRSGEPVAHATVSATVVAPDCLQADALATVFMVMEPAAALQLADRLRLRALLIGREAAGFSLRPSAGWAAN
jgi:thiamine biosynthesis lipoprotein